MFEDGSRTGKNRAAIAGDSVPDCQSVAHDDGGPARSRGAWPWATFQRARGRDAEFFVMLGIVLIPFQVWTTHNQNYSKLFGVLGGKLGHSSCGTEYWVLPVLPGYRWWLVIGDWFRYEVR